MSITCPCFPSVPVSDYAKQSRTFAMALSAFPSTRKVPGRASDPLRISYSVLVQAKLSVLGDEALYTQPASVISCQGWRAPPELQLPCNCQQGRDEVNLVLNYAYDAHLQRNDAGRLRPIRLAPEGPCLIRKAEEPGTSPLTARGREAKDSYPNAVLVTLVIGSRRGATLLLQGQPAINAKLPSWILRERARVSPG